MSDLINRKDTLEAICTWDKFGVDALGRVVRWYEGLEPYVHLRDVVFAIVNLPSEQPEIVRCCKCGFWDRDTLRHQFNDFREWNEAECKILAERDPYNEINRYTEADDFCSYAERRTDE